MYYGLGYAVTDADYAGMIQQQIQNAESLGGLVPAAGKGRDALMLAVGALGGFLLHKMMAR